MTNQNYVLLYVENPLQSADFYAKLLERRPVESSPNFAMFKLDSGVILGLWAKRDVQPKSQVTGGGHELCFPVARKPEVEQVHATWRERGVAIAQPPTEMDFGYTFLATDPDGHRLRVFAPSEG